ncbi:IS21 family transposase [Bacillus sp. REN10]|uniref:IS21 family transposase n=1 Tax=Bacillus sp. REN10 TaxID=2782541 RepID=UPI00193B4C67|nr:IS21 family transposase [Bacillus sp. REN10]
MLKMANIELIRKLHVQEGRSIRQLAKDFSCSRQSIRKALKLTEEPKYTRKAPVVNPVIDPVKPLIIEWLMNPLKQRHSAAQIHRRLVEEYGFKGGESTVRRFVRQLKQEWQEIQPPVSIPLEFDPGEYAQFDWGEVFIELNGVQVKVMLFCMRLLYSRKIFVKVFPHQRQEALFQGHADAFDYFGGVPKTIIYDNMTTAVKKILKGTKREEQEAFLQFHVYYLFDAQFCAPAKGNEKGQVEKLVQTSRSNFLVPVPSVSSLEELNRMLERRCDEYNDTKVPRTNETVKDRFVYEQSFLLPLPPTHSCAKKVYAVVNTLSLVTFETNAYSVPTVYAGQKDAEIFAYVDRVEIHLDGEVKAIHERSYERHQEVFNLDHYLDELERKSRAIQHARPLRQTEMSDLYQQFYRETLRQYGHAKELIKVLKLHREYSSEWIEIALEKSMEERLYTFDGVKQFLYQLYQPAVAKPAPFSYKGAERVEVTPPVLHSYDQLLKKGGLLH